MLSGKTLHELIPRKNPDMQDKEKIKIPFSKDEFFEYLELRNKQQMSKDKTTDEFKDWTDTEQATVVSYEARITNTENVQSEHPNMKYKDLYERWEREWQNNKTQGRQDEKDAQYEKAA